ncbi:hypothetical protein [Nakamurella sp.]|uniref:hypothetical protein n=1 Tax=Nakamurella sp. TaxID=1869182 RepID=UPI003783C3D1
MTIDGGQRRREMAEQRLIILAAIDEALRRHAEVLPVIVAAADRDAARDAVSALLGIEKIAAVAVLDLQWNRLTEAGRTAIADERARLEASVAAPD